MSWMASWVAVRASKEAVLQTLGVKDAGRRTHPGARDDLLSCAELPGGWCVVFAEDLEWVTPRRVRELSYLGDAVGCRVEDQVENTSEVWAARNGVDLWRVFHNTDLDRQLGPDRLEVSGEPPPEFTSMRERFVREQAEAGDDVDVMFELPLELAKSLCGYRHDEDDSAFICLRPEHELAPGEAEDKPRRPGFLQRLFGGRAAQSSDR